MQPPRADYGEKGSLHLWEPTLNLKEGGLQDVFGSRSQCRVVNPF